MSVTHSLRVFRGDCHRHEHRRPARRQCPPGEHLSPEPCRRFQCVATDDREMPGHRAGETIDRSPLGPTTDLARALGRLSHRLALRVVTRPYIAQGFQEQALLLRRPLTECAPLRVSDHRVSRSPLRVAARRRNRTPQLRWHRPFRYGKRS